MENTSFTAKKTITIILLALIMMLASFALSLWLTPRNIASSKTIVVLNEQNIDAYTASKNASYITNILSEVIYSNSFINNVYGSSSSLKDDLGVSQNQRLKEWKKKIKVQTQENKGIIIIHTYSNDRTQAYQLNKIVTSVLLAKHGQYDGFGDKVTLKVIDNPSINEKWFQLQIIKNSLIGLVLGLFIGFAFVVIFPKHQLFNLLKIKPFAKDETFALLDSQKTFTPYNSKWMDYSIKNSSQDTEKAEEN